MISKKNCNEGFEVYKKYVNFQSLGEIDYILTMVSDSTIIRTIESALYIKDADEEDEETSGVASKSSCTSYSYPCLLQRDENS